MNPDEVSVGPAQDHLPPVKTNHQLIYETCRELIASLDRMEGCFDVFEPSWQRLDYLLACVDSIVTDTKALTSKVHPIATWAADRAWVWPLDIDWTVSTEKVAS